MGRHTTAKLRSRDSQVEVSQHETDAPVIPMAQLAQLKEIHPQRVDWVFEQADVEGAFRRSETRRVNTLVAIERFGGLISGFVIGVVALWCAYHLAMAGHDAVAGVIGGTTVVALVGAFVVGARNRVKPRGAPPSSRGE